MCVQNELAVTRKRRVGWIVGLSRSNSPGSCNPPRACLLGKLLRKRNRPVKNCRCDFELLFLASEVRRMLSGEAADVDWKGVIARAVVPRCTLGRLDDGWGFQSQGKWSRSKTVGVRDGRHEV